MNQNINIIRINPEKQSVAAMSMRCGKNAVPEIRRIVRAKEIGWRELIEVNGVVLVTSGGVNLGEDVPGWRILGGEDTAGISILFGKGPGGAMTHVPVDRAWVEKRVRWVAGEDVKGTRERAEATLPLLSEEVRAAVRRSVPMLPTGDLWLAEEDKPIWQIALALGLTTPSTAGQRLSPMGVLVHDMIETTA